MLRNGRLSQAVGTEAALERFPTMPPHLDLGFLRAGDDGLRIREPALDFACTPNGFRGDVGLDQQAEIVPVPGVGPIAVDAGNRCPRQGESGGPGDEHLNGRVVAVVILDRRRRLHLDHPPTPAAALPDW